MSIIILSFLRIFLFSVNFHHRIQLYIWDSNSTPYVIAHSQTKSVDVTIPADKALLAFLNHDAIAQQ